jgi:hypothetical protein
VRVRLLFLSWFKTIQITEHALGLKEIDLIHFLGLKRLLTYDVLDIHDPHASEWG